MLQYPPHLLTLACATGHAGLRSVLALDASPDGFSLLAEQFAGLIEAKHRQAPHVIHLGRAEHEDTLWGQWTLKNSAKLEPVWQSRLFPDNDTRPCLLLIPDLSRLSMKNLRTVIMLAQADVAHLERHGRNATITPQFYWLAALLQDETGSVSPHVLERFVLRLDGCMIPQADKAEQLKNQLAEHIPETEKIPESLRDKLKQFRAARLSDKALERVSDYFPDATQGMRRELSLARLAASYAGLLDESLADETHLENAAQLLGLKAISQSAEHIEAPEESTPSASNAGDTPEPQPAPAPNNQPEPTPTTGIPELAPDGDEPVYQGDHKESFEPDTPAKMHLYPEDDAPIQREAYTLRLPPGQRQSTVRSVRGQVIGTQPTENLQDIAWPATFLEAAKFTPIRRKKLLQRIVDEEDKDLDTAKLRTLLNHKLHLSAKDLRCYRHAPAPEHLLVMVLDYTCRKDKDWQDALVPHLQWAYTQRAGICLVQVGAASKEIKRAQRVEVRSLLVPRLSLALDAKSGKATPLAHGLDLALNTLRKALQHGRKHVQQARLVVFTDGRGNVPLDFSRRNALITVPVKNRGVTDALEVAAKIRGLHRLETFFLNPQPQYCQQLPVELAQALGAGVVDVPRHKEYWGITP